jgi:hypothetical protein
MNFKEGKTYRFLIKNLVEMSRLEKYYILEDETGGKQMLLSDYYTKYDLQLGQFINCRVDHINCTGRVFLEPEHPYYKEGEIYDFTIHKVEYMKDKLFRTICEIKVKDVFDEFAFCRINHSIPTLYSPGQSVKCKVERVKKGTLYLSSVEESNINRYELNTFYSFKISDIRILDDDFKYFILEDSKSNQLLLKHDYYSHYGFKVGDMIECEIQKFNDEGNYVPEPKHPFYKLDMTYSFEFVKTMPDKNKAMTMLNEITVKDVYGLEVKFLSNHPLFNGNMQSKTINCIVNGIKKGKPVLGFVNEQ